MLKGDLEALKSDGNTLYCDEASWRGHKALKGVRKVSKGDWQVVISDGDALKSSGKA